MRVLMTTDTVGGVWTFTSELTRQLLRRGHSVDLVSLGREPSADQRAWAHQLQAQAEDAAAATASPTFTCTFTKTPLEWMQTNDRAFEEGQMLLLDKLQQHPADLIVANQFCFGRLATAIPRIVVAHSDVLSWAKAASPSALEPSPWLNRYTAMVQSGLLDAAAVVTPTQAMGKALAGSFFLPRNYLIIHNGVSVEPAAAPAPERRLQAITAGRLWDEAKGLQILADLRSPMPLRIAGDNTLGSDDPQTTWPEPLQNLGPLSRPALHEQFRESAVYLCTSLYEPFGLAPLEAALCGCAVVARDLPSLREVWAEAALYFTDQASLQSILQALASNAGLLAAAQARAHQRASLFTPERMASSYLHLFETVLTQHRPGQHVA